MAITKKKKLPTLAGKPLDTNVLSREIAGPSLVSVRNIFSEQLTRSLTPAAAAGFILEAQQGFPWNWLDVCQGMRRKWPHWRAITDTRRNNLLGLERIVLPASPSPKHVAHAKIIERWIKQDNTNDLISNLASANEQGFAVSEFVNAKDPVSGLWMPKFMTWSDPRFYAIDPNDGQSLLIRDNSGYYPIANIPFKFCVHRDRYDGIIINGGLCQPAIKLFVMTQIVEKFWPAFLELYGMPLRVGKLKQGAQVADKEALMAALTGLGSDAAAIITEWCDIEFKDAAGKGASSDVYKTFLEYQNDQASKLVLGQTFTMGGSGTSGGSGLSHSGQEQGDVRHDILKSDTRGMESTLNSGPVKWIIELNDGEQADGMYPRIKFQIDEAEDMDKKAAMISALLPYNPDISKRWARGLVGAPDPEPGEELLTQGGAMPSGKSPEPESAEARRRAMAALDPAAAPPAAGANPEAALTGIQIESALKTIYQYNSGLITYRQALAILINFFKLERSAAAEMLGGDKPPAIPDTPEAPSGDVPATDEPVPYKFNPVMETPTEPVPTTGEVAPTDKVVNPALTGYIPEGELVVPPYTPPQPWNSIPVMPYAHNRIIKGDSAAMMAKLKELAKKYKSEDYKARTMARMDKAIAETESVTAILAKELRKKK